MSDRTLQDHFNVLPQNSCCGPRNQIITMMTFHCSMRESVTPCMWGTFNIWPQRKIYELQRLDNYCANENSSSPFLYLRHYKTPLGHNAFIRGTLHQALSPEFETLDVHCLLGRWHEFDCWFTGKSLKPVWYTKTAGEQDTWSHFQFYWKKELNTLFY